MSLTKIGLSQYAIDWLGDAVATQNGKLTIGNQTIFTMKYVIQKVNPVTGQPDPPLNVYEHPDKYIKLGNDFHLFTSLQIQYPDHFQDAFEWSHNNGANAWYEAAKGWIWFTGGDQALPQMTAVTGQE